MVSKSMPGGMVLVTGPAGAAKHTVISRIMRLNTKHETIIPGLELGTAVTTRAPRPQDAKAQKKYRYVSKTEFLELLRSEELIQSVQLSGAYYGVPRPEPDARLILDIDLKGVADVKTKISAFAVFLMPPGRNDNERIANLQERLLSHDNLQLNRIDARLAQARQALILGPAEADLVVVSDGPLNTATKILDALKTYFR
jgi:guanylate kinase